MTESALTHILKDNFEKYQVMWNDRRFHTHTSHHLGSLALLGADDELLKDIYAKVSCRFSKEYELSPHEINDDNWRDSLGEKKFCLAYRDYFIDKLPKDDDNWKAKLFEILLDDSQGLPLIHAIFCGLFHSLIHVDYALELNDRLVACEALTLTVVNADETFQKFVHQLKSPINGTKQPIEILKEIYADINAPKDIEQNDSSFISLYYNQWKVPDCVNEIIEQLFDMSVYLYGATHKPDQVDFSFVFIHLITGANAIRKIQSNFDEIILRKLLHVFFYLTLKFYIAQQQPLINEQLIDNYEVENEKLNWKYVIDKILNTKLAAELHVPKIVRALRDAEQDYGSKNQFYLKTAIKTVDNLNVDIEWDYYKSVEPWIGMPHSERQLNLKHNFSI